MFRRSDGNTIIKHITQNIINTASISLISMILLQTNHPTHHTINISIILPSNILFCHHVIQSAHHNFDCSSCQHLNLSTVRNCRGLPTDCHSLPTAIIKWHPNSVMVVCSQYSRPPIQQSARLRFISVARPVRL